jgi:hypothetical protein
MMGRKSTLIVQLRSRAMGLPRNAARGDVLTHARGPVLSSEACGGISNGSLRACTTS